ncbi:MAG: hypothetical protein K2X27_08440 [Candidatus Obscuribacterales bacterium]|nr:hypothetical protein [Candidatus Obscuribacterales bacterium]
MTDCSTGECAGDNWFADLIGDGSQIADQLMAVKTFAYAAFDKIDQNRNGFLAQDELNTALCQPVLEYREKAFLKFLLDNYEQISESFDEGHGEGISRADLESYFDLIATLL